jgi:hypothetical protein
VPARVGAMQRQTTAGERGSLTAPKRLMAVLPLVFAPAVSLANGDRISGGTGERELYRGAPA